MAKVKVSDIAKSALSIVSSACVDALVCGGTAAIIPVSLMNPVVGGLIIAGGAIVAAAVHDRVVDPYVEKTVDKFEERVEEAKACIEVLKSEELPEN